MKKLIALFVIITSLTTLSCNKDDDAPEQPDMLIGKWYYVSETSVVKAGEVKATKRVAETVKTYNFIEFKAGGIYTQGTQTGTASTEDNTYPWIKIGNIITLISSKGNSAISITKITDTELIITYGKDTGREGDTETYTKIISNATDMSVR